MPQNPWILPWICQRDERGCYRTFLDELITDDIPRSFTSYNVFALIPWLVKPYSRRQLTREEKIANYRISRVVENSFGILVKRFRVLLTTMEQRPKVVRDIVLICVVLHSMLRSHQGGADRAPTPADNIQPPQGDHEEQRHQQNFRNPSRANINETY